MGPYQVHRINQVLRELQICFRNSQASEYLQLAEEPKENDEAWRVTFGDMMILFTAYRSTIFAYQNHKLWRAEQ